MAKDSKSYKNKWEAKDYGSRGGFVTKMTRGCSLDYKRGFSTGFSFCDRMLTTQKEAVKKWANQNWVDDGGMGYKKVRLDDLLEFLK